MTAYNLHLRNSAGESIGYLSDFAHLEWARSVNTIGKAVIELPYGYSHDAIGRDYRIEIWRQPKGGSMYLEGRCFWLVRQIRRTLLPRNRWITTITCHDTLDILDRRIVDYTRETNYADKLIINGNDDYEDDLMKEFVRENLGSLATNTDRNISTLSVAGDRGEGSNASSEKQASSQVVLGVLQELAQHASEGGTPVYFDIVAEPDNTMTFITRTQYLGVDHSDDSDYPVTFSNQLSNLRDIELIWDYTKEVTAITVAGAGQGAGRAIEHVIDSNRINASPFNRIERMHDARDLEGRPLLQAEGRIQLEKGVPKLIMTARAVEMSDLRYGLQYHYGDLVTAQIDRFKFDCHIDMVSGTVEGGQEELDIRLRGEQAL